MGNENRLTALDQGVMDRKKKCEEHGNPHENEKGNQDTQGESRGLAPARKLQTAIRTAVVDRRGSLMQEGDGIRDDYETSGWI
jgi:hypothetical protein